jgi:hypothetical protein
MGVLSSIGRVGGALARGAKTAAVWSQVPGFEASGITAPIGPYEIGTLRDGTVFVVKGRDHYSS